MTSPQTFAEIVDMQSDALSRTERRVALHFAANLHQVLVQSAMELANAIGTSDATVIRTARALGFEGIEDLRRFVANEFRTSVSPANRLSRTIEETGGDLRKAFEATMTTQTQALASLRESVDVEEYMTSVRLIAGARQTAVFGIGPSASIAEYFCTQLRRFGLSARSMSRTGLLLADDLLALEPGDLVIIMAYGRVYPELDVLIRHASDLGLRIILLTDSIEARFVQRVNHILTIPRGRIDAFSLHTVTLAFLESLLVGVATLMPQATVSSLDRLNALRVRLAGRAMGLHTGQADLLPSEEH